MAVTGNKQFSILRALLDTPEGAAFQKDLGRKLTAGEREGLVGAGLIECERRGNSFWLKLTEKGRTRAAETNVPSPKLRKKQNISGDKQFSALRALLDTPTGAGFQKDIKPALKLEDREALANAGLIKSESRGRSFWLELTEKGRNRAAGIRVSEAQALILWALLAEENGSSFQDDLPEKAAEPDIEALTQAGLVAKENRDRATPWLEVTDRGWAWASENLDAQLPKRARTLGAWLRRLDAFMRARGFALAEILGPQPQLEPIEPYGALNGGAHPSAPERIRSAYLDITGGKFNEPVHLCDIRDRLQDIERAELDAALRQLHLSDDCKLSGLDNPDEVTSRIRDAALDFKGMTMLEIWISK